MGARIISIGVNIAREEVQEVSVSRSGGCGHPAVAVRANDGELAIGCITIAASGEE